jgi:hypothetical protein
MRHRKGSKPKITDDRKFQVLITAIKHQFELAKIVENTSISKASVRKILKEHESVLTEIRSLKKELLSRKLAEQAFILADDMSELLKDKAYSKYKNCAISLGIIIEKHRLINDKATVKVDYDKLEKGDLLRLLGIKQLDQIKPDRKPGKLNRAA